MRWTKTFIPTLREAPSLLVLDRRAKLAANDRADQEAARLAGQEAARLAEQTGQARDSRREALARREREARQAWERKRAGGTCQTKSGSSVTDAR